LTRSDSARQGQLRWGEKLYCVYLVYWLWGRGYEGPSSSLEIGPLKEKLRFMISGSLQGYWAGQSQSSLALGT
jgi:hypothetical protein